MHGTEVSDYREFLRKYAESTKARKPGFSLGSWARTLGLKSTSSLTKVINGEREAGPELLEKLVRYFKFDTLEESQFRNLVTLSKLKESAENKTELAAILLRSAQTKSLKRRMMELEHFELLESYLPMAVRECTRLPKMTIARLSKIFATNEERIQKAVHVLDRLNFLKRDSAGHFLASDDHLHTDHEIPSEAIQTYHESSFDLAKEKLKSVDVLDREFQSLVLLLNHQDLPVLKKKIRDFLDSLEVTLPSPEVNQLFQVQLQVFPVTEKFENLPNPNFKSGVQKND